MKIMSPNGMRLLIVLSLALGFLLGRRVSAAKVSSAK